MAGELHSLGAMTSTTHKLAIAVEYLDTAATLWIHEAHYFSAAHLAAAAEEISGKACRMKRKTSYFDDMRNKVRRTLVKIGIPHTERELIDAFYEVKNSIKHMDGESDSIVAFDPKKEAAEYIIGAYQNFTKLGLDGDLSQNVAKVLEANTIYIRPGA